MKNLLISLLLIPLAASSQFKSGENIHITEIQQGDFYVAGGSVTVSAAITGDLVVAGGQIYLNDSIGEDLIVAGGDVSVKGMIGDDIRCAGGTIDFEGEVKEDMIVFGGDVMIGRDAEIGGDLIVFGGKVMLLGKINGNVKASGGEVTLSGSVNKDINVKSEEFTLNGNVKGNATLASKELYIDRQARIEGNLDYWTSEEDVNIPPEVVKGSINYLESLKPVDSDFNWPWAGSIILFLTIGYVLAAFLTVLVFHLLFGKQFNKAATSWKSDFGKSLGYGTLYVLGTPIIIALLIATIIGVPLGIFLLTLYIFSWVFGLAVGGLVLSNFYNQYEDRNWSKGMIVIMALVSVILIRLITLIPFIGWLIGLLFVVSTYGAFILSWISNRKSNIHIT